MIEAALADAEVAERDDFVGGLYLASGSLGDPTTTNTTLTNFFDRHTIGIDRGYITYNPLAHKWISLTGGKFAYTWLRTPQTFDNDLNPEGFSEKLSWDFTTPIVKNLSFTAMQLQRHLGCEYNTAWFLHHRVMEAMREGGLDLPPLGGARFGHRAAWAPARDRGAG